VYRTCGTAAAPLWLHVHVNTAGPRQLGEYTLVEEVEHLELFELADGRVDGLDLVLVEQQLLQVGGTRDVRLDLLDLVVRGLELS
jgi:hypothetical protein